MLFKGFHIVRIFTKSIFNKRTVYYTSVIEKTIMNVLLQIHIGIKPISTKTLGRNIIDKH